MDLPKPSKSFDITIDGKRTTIDMTYGLFNEIMKVIPDPSKITDLVITDPYLRDYIVRRLLTGNKRVERDEDLVDPFDLDLDLDELDELVTWVGEHVLHFFMKSASKTAEVAQKYQATATQLTQLSPLLPGAEN